MPLVAGGARGAQGLGEEPGQRRRRPPRAPPRAGSGRSAAPGRARRRPSRARSPARRRCARRGRARPRARAAAPRPCGRRRRRRARGRSSPRRGSPRRWRRSSPGRRRRAGSRRRPRGRRCRSPRSQAASLRAQVELGVGADQPLGQRRRLDQEEPVVVAGGEGHVGFRVHRGRRGDVEDRPAADRSGVVERHPVRHPPAAVVAGDGEAVEPEAAHHRHLVGGHRPLRVGRMVGRRRRLRGAAVAAQVGQHHAEPGLDQPRRHPVPAGVGLRVAVQQQHRRAVPGLADPDGDAVADLDARVGEAGQHRLSPPGASAGSGPGRGG